jgi:hypothetical protein
MPTIKQLTIEAKQYGIIRAKGTYNGKTYWRWPCSNAIITRDRLLEILGY